MLNNENATIFIPDGIDETTALKRTTHLAISAHQDDIELMAPQGVLECFGSSEKFFTGVVTADGAGSPRNGIYASYTDEEMKKVRIREQQKAAYVGDYSAQLQLGYTSSQIKDASCDAIVDEYVDILKATRPDVVFTHNLADKHDTHMGVVTKVIKAIRKLEKSERPTKLYGGEVWRDLDWMLDEDKVVFDTSEHPNITAGIMSVFDSQICGGKRYDLAAEGRRVSHATYYASHGCDTAQSLNYCMDLTPLIEDDTLSITDYVLTFVDRFKNDVVERINKVSKVKK